MEAVSEVVHKAGVAWAACDAAAQVTPCTVFSLLSAFSGLLLRVAGALGSCCPDLLPTALSLCQTSPCQRRGGGTRWGKEGGIKGGE